MSGRAILLAALCLLSAGCVHYRPLPLPPAPDLAPAAKLTVLPSQFQLPGLRPHPLPANGLDEIAVVTLAVENNPGLKAARLQDGVAAAQLFQAGLLPDPVLSAGLSTSTHAGYDVGVAQSLEALILRGAARAGARAQVRAVNLDILWQEWQVGEQARALFIESRQDAELSALLQRWRRLEEAAYRRDRAATHRGDQTGAVVDADLAALTSTETALRQVQLDATNTGQSLRALLGLATSAPLPLVGEARPPALSAAQYRSALDAMPRRRPDLLALRAGYQSQEQALRRAILAQFPALAVNLTRSRDPIEAADSTGVGLSLTLPLFNRNRGQIAIQTATRAALRQQYQARLDQARGMATGAWAAAQLLQRQLTQLEARLPALNAAAANAGRALRQGDVSAALDLSMQTAALNAQADAIRLRGALATNQASLDTLLAVPFR